MSTWAAIEDKIQGWIMAKTRLRAWQQQGLEVVFTNGCFDLLHYGHLHYLAQAKDQGDHLVIGLNSGASVSRLKGPHRPINDDLTRLHALASLSFVDMVVLFDEDTPLSLIQTLQPDVLVKGGDWAVEQIVGSAEVMARGGRVLSLPFVEGYSTTNIEQKILNR